MTKIPRSVIAVDVETTGLSSDDRIVSLGAWQVDCSNLHAPSLKAECLYLICNPGKKSHPRAEKVHGYSDWTLRHQDPFSEHAKSIREFLSNGDIVVAHNATFDLGFIAREFQNLGQESPICRHYCTMNGYRRSGLAGRASLKAICEEMGMRRIGEKHGALEDAWLALMIYLWLHKANPIHIQPFANLVAKGLQTEPINFRLPPQQPINELPRREETSHASSKVSKLKSNYDDAAATRLLKAVRPTAILLLEIARSDQSLAVEEIDILVSLIRTSCDSLSLKPSDEVERKVLGELLDLDLSQNLLTRAARALYQDTRAREAFPKWFATMATAEGEVSPDKRASIDRVKAAISRIVPK